MSRVLSVLLSEMLLSPQTSASAVDPAAIKERKNVY